MCIKNKNAQSPQLRAFTLTEIAIVLGVMGLLLAAIWSTYTQVIQSNKVKQAGTEILMIVQKVQQISYFTPSYYEQGTDNGCVGYLTTCPATPPTCGSTFGPPGTCTPPSPCTPGIPKNYGSISGTSSMQTTAIREGVYIPSMVSGTESSPIVSSPWGKGDVYVAVTESNNSCSANAALVTPGQTLSPSTPGYVSPPIAYSGTFALYFENVPTYACAPLLLTYAIPWVAAGLSKICVGAAGSTTCSYGSNITSATTINGPNVAFWCGGSQAQSVSLGLTFSLVHP